MTEQLLLFDTPTERGLNKLKKQNLALEKRIKALELTCEEHLIIISEQAEEVDFYRESYDDEYNTKFRPEIGKQI